MLAKQRSCLLGVNFRELDQMFDLKFLAFRNPACIVRFSLRRIAPMRRAWPSAVAFRFLQCGEPELVANGGGIFVR